MVLSEILEMSVMSEMLVRSKTSVMSEMLVLSKMLVRAKTSVMSESFNAVLS